MLKRRRAFRTFVIVLLIILGLSMVLTACLGALSVPMKDTYAILTHHLFGSSLPSDGHITAAAENVIWKLRFPRILLGVVVGAALALAGVIMQASVQNSMADPYVLGISSGATLGATVSIMLIAGTGSIFANVATPLAAFVGAILATVCVLTLASTGSQLTASRLVLSGMIMNALFSAFSNFVITAWGSADGMLDLKFWTMGSLARASWDTIGPVAFVVAACLVFFMTQFRALNVMLMGDEAAVTLGIDTRRRRWAYLIICALMVGCVVAAAGTIGFVGLMIPHVTRSLVGSDHRRLIPASVLIGSIFMLWADAVARIMIANTEVPIGILTAVVGAPFFVYVMVGRGYGFTTGEGA